MFIDGVDAGLTQNEYKIVSLLGKYAGKVMTYDYIIKEIWGPNMKNDNRILRVNMANIRRKIEKKFGGAAVYFYRGRRRIPDRGAGLRQDAASERKLNKIW